MPLKAPRCLDVKVGFEDLRGIWFLEVDKFLKLVKDGYILFSSDTLIPNFASIRVFSGQDALENLGFRICDHVEFNRFKIHLVDDYVYDQFFSHLKSFVECLKNVYTNSEIVKKFRQSKIFEKFQDLKGKHLILSEGVFEFYKDNSEIFGNLIVSPRKVYECLNEKCEVCREIKQIVDHNIEVADRLVIDNL